MSTINSNLSVPELVKIEVDGIEREKNNVKLKMKMLKLVRERERLKKEVDLLEKTQSFTELEKFSLEEKLERSERRCEELDAEVKKLRQKKMESEKAAQFYKSRVDDLEPRLMKMEEKFAKMLNVNILDFAENAEVEVNAEDADGNGGIGAGFSKKGGRKSAHTSKVSQTQSKGPLRDDEEQSPEVVRGGRNLVYSGTEEDGANVTKKSKVDESKGRLQDIEDTNPEVRGAGYRVSLYSRCTLTTIDVIKHNLQKENLEIFEQSCFSDLLKMNEFKYQGELILQLMLHLDLSASNKERLIFKINNSNMEFGPGDFSRITGLRLGKLGATLTTSSSIHNDVFQGCPTITLRNIRKAFLSISSCHKGKGELTLKLALLYFLYGTVLAKHNHKRVDVQYLNLIEDLQDFNAFPWGQIAYDVLVSSIIQLRLRMDGSEVTNQVARFEMHGFCYALQAWAYEVMPCLATYCASRANNFENITPWILRWSVKRLLRFDDLKNFFQPGDKAHLNTMGKSEELSTDTIPPASTPLSRAKQKKRKLLCDSDQIRRVQPSSVATPSTPSPPPSTSSSTFLSHHLDCKLFRAEGMLETLLRKVDQPILDISNDELPKNKFPWVDDVSAVTVTRHSTSVSKPISVNIATDEHAKIAKSLGETETTALSEPANDNPALDSLWKTYNVLKVSEPEYKRTKEVYEKLLNRSKHLKLWIGYAKFEAFAMKDTLEEPDLPDKRKCLERARAVFERGLSYFRSCGPESNEKRAMLLEEWLDMESSFGEVGDVNLVRVKLPQKLKKTRRRAENADGDGYEEYIEYQFPE